MQKLDDVLTNFIESLEEEVGETQDQLMDIPQPPAPISHTIENIPQITVRDPDRPTRTKGHPRNAIRIQSGLEQAQEKKKGRNIYVADVVNLGIIEQAVKSTCQCAINIFFH